MRQLELDDNLTYDELLEGIQKESNIPKCYIKLIAPTVGLVKAAKLPQGEQTLIKDIFTTESSRKKVTLLGPSQEKIGQMHDAETARAKELVKMNQRVRNMRRLAKTPMRSTEPPSKFTFERIEPLAGLPNPEKSRQFLNRLKDDRGVRALMDKYKWTVPLLTELGPNEPNNLLGRNTGNGQMIELRVRTDAYDGWRSYADVVRVLCHELAHNEVSDHNRQFWDLTNKLEREVIALNPFGRAGRQLVGQVFNPEDAPECDDGGWFGGTHKLGTLAKESPSATNTGDSSSTSNSSAGPVIEGKPGTATTSPEDDSIQSKARRAAEDRQRRFDN